MTPMVKRLQPDEQVERDDRAHRLYQAQRAHRAGSLTEPQARRIAADNPGLLAKAYVDACVLHQELTGEPTFDAVLDAMHRVGHKVAASDEAAIVDAVVEEMERSNLFRGKVFDFVWGSARAIFHCERTERAALESWSAA